jgi:hypothetical protein
MDARQQYERLLKRLPPEQFDYEAVFRRICDAERRRHRSVKLVRELTGVEPRVDRELLAFVGFPNAEPLGWSIDDSLTYGSNQFVPKGGMVKAARLPGDRNVSTFVFLKCQEETSPETRNCVLIAVLMHEMGHVDDIERGKHLRFDGLIDIVAAEEYAHRYALRRMMRENLRFPLGFLLGCILKDARLGDEGTVSRESATRIVESGEYNQFRQFVGDLVNVEETAGLS